MNCPSCGSPATSEGQPSKRQFYACGSFGYDGKLADMTLLCCAWAELAAVTEQAERYRRTSLLMDATIASLTAERDALQVQRDQSLHILAGGTLTVEEVTASGLGEGALIEARRMNAERDALKTELQKRCKEDSTNGT